MASALKVHVVGAKTQRPVHGAVIELSYPRTPAMRASTNRSGISHFSVREELGPKSSKSPVFVRVLDIHGQELGTSNAEPETTSAGDRLQVEIEEGQLACAALPRAPQATSLIGDDIFRSIRTAALSAAPAHAKQQVTAALDAVFCSLPPIFSLHDLIDLGAGVLRGSIDDARMFRSMLADLESWSHWAYQYERSPLSDDQHTDVLSSSNLKKLAKQERWTRPQPNGYSVVSSEPAIIVLAAAMRVAGNDPALINRNVGIVLEQFCGVDALASLYESARTVLFGGAFENQMFMRQLGFFGGVCGEFGFPRPGGFPPTPQPPSPLPCPDGRPWPPLPGLPLPGPVRFRGGECPLGEIVRGAREALQRRQNYSITGISPAHACVGEVITITGTGFDFEGHPGAVNFPGAERGTLIPAEPLSWTDTEIAVVVPPGAHDGDLQLDIPGARDQLLVCDAVVDLFVSSSDSIRFEGGETAVLHFSIGASVDGCLAPGTAVWLAWRVTNADHLTLTVADEHGSVIDLRRLNADSSGVDYRLPLNLDRNRTLTLTLEAEGPCGSDSATQTIPVARGRPHPGGNPFDPGSFENFLGDIRRVDIRTATPANLAELLKAVEVVEASDRRLGVKGGGCSYNDLVVPRASTMHMIDPDRLRRTSHDDRVTPPRRRRRSYGTSLNGRFARIWTTLILFSALTNLPLTAAPSPR